MVVMVVGSWKALALRGAAAVLFAILTLVWPGITLAALVSLFGAFALVTGAMALVGLFAGGPEGRPRRSALAFYGLLGVVTGAVTFAWPHITALALLYLIAAWAFLAGAIDLVAAYRLREDRRIAALLGAAGALAVLLAVVLVVEPGAGALGITWAIGWYALVSGSLLLVLAWQVRKLEAPLRSMVQAVASAGSA